MNHPTVLLVDEPTSALDSERGRSILDLIVRLSTEQHTATLLVTHDPHLLARASRSYTMADGTVTLHPAAATGTADPAAATRHRHTAADTPVA